MANRTFICNKCQSIVRLVEGQHVGKCFSCQAKYYSSHEIPPAVILKSTISRDEARNRIAQALKHGEVASDFRSRATFIGAHRYFIPIFEVRTVEAGWKGQAFSEDTVFYYSSGGKLMVANDLADLDIDTLDLSILDQALLNAEIIPFEPLEVRKSGVILPFTELKLIQENDNIMKEDQVEKFYRLIFFPVWQVSYRYNGLVFKNYISAVDGQIVAVKALGEHKKKLVYTLLGLLSVAVFFGRGVVEGPIFAILSLAVGIPLLILLVPYFWELYAFRELVQIQGDTVTRQSMGIADHSFGETLKLFFENLVAKGQKGNR